MISGCNKHRFEEGCNTTQTFKMVLVREIISIKCFPNVFTLATWYYGIALFLLEPIALRSACRYVANVEFSLYYGITIFVDYFMPKSSLKQNYSNYIQLKVVRIKAFMSLRKEIVRNLTKKQY